MPRLNGLEQTGASLTVNERTKHPNFTLKVRINGPLVRLAWWNGDYKAPVRLPAPPTLSQIGFLAVTLDCPVDLRRWRVAGPPSHITIIRNCSRLKWR